MTADDLKTRLRNKLAALADKSTDSVFKVMLENIQYGSSHYEELDQAGKDLVDEGFRQLNEISDVAAENFQEQPDSVEKRTFLRNYKKVKGNHFNIKWLISLLERSKDECSDIEKQGEELFMFCSQMALDYLNDVTDAPLKTKDAALMGLLYSAVDEVIVAFHLAKHGYAPQSITHSRSVLETLDKVELFNAKPQFLSAWAEPENWKQFLPAAVREKLGKPRYNAVYGWLSEMGTHSTFRYMQSKVQQRVLDEEQKLEVKINVGGSSSEDDKNNAYVTCIYVTSLIIFKIREVYREFLLSEEISANTKKLKDMMQIYYQTLGVVEPPELE